MSPPNDQQWHPPFLPGVSPKPDLWAWHVKPTPHSAGVYFTNADARLRPRESFIGPQLYFLDDTSRLEITPYNFPELYADLKRMERHADVHGYRFYILPVVANIARHIPSERAIILSAQQMSAQKYEDFLFWAGHEIGHAWRFAHDRAKPVPIHGGNFINHRDYTNQKVDTAKRDEVEADLAAACLLGSIQPALNAFENFRKYGESSEYPSTERRIAALKAMSPFDCTHFDLNYTFKPLPTPKLMRPAAHTK